MGFKERKTIQEVTKEAMEDAMEELCEMLSEAMEEDAVDQQEQDEHQEECTCTRLEKLSTIVDVILDDIIDGSVRIESGQELHAIVQAVSSLEKLNA